MKQNLFLFTLMFYCFGIMRGVVFPQTSSFEDSVEFELQPGIKLGISLSQFDSTKHSIERCSISGWNGICLIDSKPAFGTDWELPRSEINDIYIEINRYRIKLENSAMFNPWFGEPDIKSFALQKWTEDGWILRGHFSDGAGSYVVEWRILKNKSLRTIISDDEAILASFFP